jgi:alkylated DNA repair dioxygenase AlkB
MFNFQPISILPYDGETIYHGKIFNEEQSLFYLNKLLHNIEWKQDEVILFGKKIITARKVAWYGDNYNKYTYSNVTKTASLFSPELLEIKTIVEKITRQKYNSCLLNLYHSGNEGMSWHSDDEKMILENSSIASISFGAERVFKFKHKKNNTTIKFLLENGSLLDMKGETQKYWLHALPKLKSAHGLRINLTFRNTLTEN